MDFEPRYICGRDGGRLRTATFAAVAGVRPCGVCVLLNGQTEFIEKYSEVIGELAARGFQVATLDWRGQGGSRRVLPERRKVHIEDFGQYDEDLSAFMDMVVRPLSERPPLVLAHSMGAHIVLRALHWRPAQFSAAVLSAPMIAVATRGHSRWLVRTVCYLENLTGHQDDWVWGIADRGPAALEFSQQIVTSDEARFRRTRDFIARHPEIRTSGPSWGWLEAAYRSMAYMRKRGFAEGITTPILVCGAGRDRIVETAAVAEFAGRLPNGAYLEIANSEHEMLMENDAIRARFWAAFDKFVAKHVTN